MGCLGRIFPVIVVLGGLVFIGSRGGADVGENANLIGVVAVVVLVLIGGWYVYRWRLQTGGIKAKLEETYIEMLAREIRVGKITEEQANQKLEEWREKNYKR